MKLIVGLGNPGEKYKNNRHNVGFMFVDYLINEFRITNYEFSKKGNLEYAWIDLKGNKIELIKPQTFMNKSGSAVRYALKKHPELKKNNLIVAHDDLDIPLGKIKIQKGTGPRLHNGIESVENYLQTKDFLRIRIGVDNRTQNNWVDGETYVLQDFKPEEKKKVIETFPKIWSRIKENFSFDF